MTLRFGTDGIRGNALSDLTNDLVTSVGRACARVLGVDNAYLVGRDTRESGPGIEAALVAGLAAEGAEAVRLGVIPTPGLAYLAQKRSTPAAMISASHNPYEDNGIKFFSFNGVKLSDETERRIEAELDSLAAEPALTPGTRAPGTRASGAMEPGNPDSLHAGGMDEYVDHLVSALDGRRLDGMAVVVDCGHGAAFEVAPKAFDRLGAKVDVRHAEPDGKNINANCGSTHPEYLSLAVMETGADMGLALDGDADRCIAVDERGELVDGDRILAIAAIDLKGRGLLEGNSVVTTVMANLGFREAMRAHDIRVVETPVGDRYVREEMEAQGVALGGEQSGHLIFRSLATTGDGVLTGLLLADVMKRTGSALSELASVVTGYPQVLVNVRVANRKGLEDATSLWQEVAAVESELGETGRVLVRPSGTEPVIRVMVEARDALIAETSADRIARQAVEVLGSPKP